MRLLHFLRGRRYNSTVAEGLLEAVRKHYEPSEARVPLHTCHRLRIRIRHRESGLPDELYRRGHRAAESVDEGPPTIALKGLIQIGKNSERMSVLRGLLRRPNCPDFTRLSRLQAAFVRTFHQAYIQRKNRVFWLKIAPDTSHGMSGLSEGITEAP